MKSLLTTTILLFGYAKSAKVASVPDNLAGVFGATGQPCMTDSDCDDLYQIPDDFPSADTYEPYWMCMNDTIANTNSSDPGVCLFMGCDTTGDCEDNQMCKYINICNPDTDEFYNTLNNVDYLHSTMCMDLNLCDDNMQTPGNWTDDTMCYTVKAGDVVMSEEEGVICENACVVSSDTCISSPDDGGASTDCKDDETCCTSEGWDEAGCAELLITVYLIYTIIVAVVICFCCVGCCCLCYKKSKGRNATFQDDMDTTTNHYNVYI